MIEALHGLLVGEMRIKIERTFALEQFNFEKVNCSARIFLQILAAE
jgi:hypothetical protein